MLLRALAAVALAGLALPATAAPAPSSVPRVALVAHDGALLRSSPSSRARVLAQLVQQSQVEMLGNRKRWARVRVWDSLRGWIALADLTARRPWSSVSTYRAPTTVRRVNAAGPYPLREAAWTTAPTPLASDPERPASSSLRSGTPVTVTAWRQDRHGRVWYRINHLWARADSVVFPTARAGPWWRVTGKGMWLTLGTIAGTSPDVLTTAAARLGVTHLYLEAAISPLGFHGRRAVPALIDSAHRRHISVIAWVYPYLQDIASDVSLTRAVANFHTSQGDRFDGIAADLERNITTGRVRTYSQLVRAYLGSNYLLVGVTYPPQSFPNYPFAEVGRQYDVISPMDYWHQTRTQRGLDYGGEVYGWPYGYRYAVDSIAAIHRTAGPSARVAPIGQAFDNFGRLEMGPHAPSPAEITGFLRGCRQAGAIGVSFFQWMTTTDSEWRAIRAFRY